MAVTVLLKLKITRFSLNCRVHVSSILLISLKFLPPVKLVYFILSQFHVSFSSWGHFYGPSFFLCFYPFRFQVPLTRIKSLNHFRAVPVPSPISKVFVQCLPAEPGEMSPAQDHLRMTLEVDGKTSRRMLVPIWVTLLC